MPMSIRQAGVIPHRDGLVCLVTSRSGRRWVIPKGLIDPGHTAGEAALVEAWEEAGLLGTLQGPLGSFHYEKNTIDHHVTVFILRVSEEKASWPEQSIRRREWVSIDEAINRVDEPGLKELLRTWLLQTSPSTDVATSSSITE